MPNGSCAFSICCAVVLVTAGSTARTASVVRMPGHVAEIVQVPTAAPAPEAGPPAPPVFHAESALVILHVNVFDDDHDAVPDLPQSAFTVQEDGTPQTISFFSSEEVPVASGLVLDNSSSFIAHRDMVVAGARAFAASRRPEDEAFTVIFNEHVRSGLPPGVQFSHSEPTLLWGLRVYRPGGRTALYDAVIAAIDHVERAMLQKHVLVVLSDGDDNASVHSEREMHARVASSDVIIFTVGAGVIIAGHSRPSLLRELARESGGRAYFPESERGVVDAFAQIGRNIRRGYRIGYVPSHDAPGKYHSISVRVRVPGRDHLRAYARHGYLAPN